MIIPNDGAYPGILASKASSSLAHSCHTALSCIVRKIINQIPKIYIPHSAILESVMEGGAYWAADSD